MGGDTGDEGDASSVTPRRVSRVIFSDDDDNDNDAADESDDRSGRRGRASPSRSSGPRRVHQPQRPSTGDDRWDAFLAPNDALDVHVTQVDDDYDEDEDDEGEGDGEGGGRQDKAAAVYRTGAAFERPPPLRVQRPAGGEHHHDGHDGEEGEEGDDASDDEDLAFLLPNVPLTPTRDRLRSFDSTVGSGNGNGIGTGGGGSSVAGESRDASFRSYRSSLSQAGSRYGSAYPLGDDEDGGGDHADDDAGDVSLGGGPAATLHEEAAGAIGLHARGSGSESMFAQWTASDSGVDTPQQMSPPFHSGGDVVATVQTVDETIPSSSVPPKPATIPISVRSGGKARSRKGRGDGAASATTTATVAATASATTAATAETEVGFQTPTK